MDSKKISVSLSEPDVAFIDRYTAEHEVASRSATVQRAIGLLRASELPDAYIDAWQEWSEQDEAEWGLAVADGLDHRGDAAR